MRITVTVLMVVVGAWAWTARPATGGDEDKARIGQLEADVARLTAELTPLREMVNTLRQNTTVVTRSLTALTNSLKASRDLIAALTTHRDQLRTAVNQLRADIVTRPEDDPARLKLALRDAQELHTTDVTQMQETINTWTELANRRAIRMTVAENELAVAKDKHAGEVTALKAKLAKAEATINQLRAAK